jgi:hypothetical protein
MAITRSLWMYLLLFLNISIFCVAEEVFSDSVETVEEKIYVPHDQILLTNEGIFLIKGNTLIPVPQLNCDEHGIYVPPALFAANPRCPKGHVIRCWRCYGCSWRRCEYSCQCR